jgi:hypothetical protein
MRGFAADRSKADAEQRIFAMTDDPIMTEIMAGITQLMGGDRPGGRGRLEAVWARIEGDPEPFHECVLSHYLADAQDDLVDELAWDLRSLDAALRCTDADAQRHQNTLSIAVFMPSVHINLAEDYFKLGDLARSRDHLAAGRGCMGALADDAYGQLIRRGADRLARQLDAA